LRKHLVRRAAIMVGAVAVAMGLLTPVNASANPMLPWSQGHEHGPAEPIQPYIVGGRDATQAYPFMASLQTADGRIFCGGSLIDRSWVLSAAHCMSRVVPGETRVRIGSTDRASGGSYVGVKYVEVKKEYDPEKSGNDAALIELDQAVPQRPIPIASQAGPVGTPTRVMGFGTMCDRDFSDPTCIKAADKLQELDTKRVAASQCYVVDPTTGKRFYDAKTLLCTASRDDQAKSACFGDSGGPQVEERRGRLVLIGATTGDGDDWELRPNVCVTGPDGRRGTGVWENVTMHRAWIAHTLRRCDPRAADEVERNSAAA
jgi:secreted trypsin-like serine protease